MTERVPAIEGFFTLDDEPRLIGTKCASCGTYFFPKEKVRCRNPSCGSRELGETTLSRTGTLWSFTNAGYAPPEPFIPRKTPYEPFAIAAVELAEEKLCVLGMVVEGVACSDLKAGMTMELVVDVLFERDGKEVLTWKWKPVASAGGVA